MKDKHIAVAYDYEGNCLFVAKVKTVSEQQVNQFVNEVNETYSKRLQEKANLKLTIKSLQQQVKCLKSVLSHILGYSELDEESIKEILESDECEITLDPQEENAIQEQPVELEETKDE